jgi:uncharacterized membrane protein
VKSADRKRIAAAIAAAETGTTGTIAVRVLPDRAIEAFESAKHEFGRHGLHLHPTANAALILVAPRARRYAIVGDSALHERVGDDFWNSVVSEMHAYFAYGQITEGIVHATNRLGVAFHKHFATAGPKP